MAELVLKIRDGAGYKDGDVLCAINRRTIRFAHAQRLCHVSKAKRNGSGLILRDGITADWYEATHQYRFERASSITVRRINLLTGETEIFGETPNVKGEAMDVRIFIRRRKQLGHHCLFGEDGAEVWYGGASNFNDSALDKVWAAIEKKTGRKETEDEFQWFPSGQEQPPQEVMLRIPVDYREGLIARGQVPPFPIKYFGADRQYHVGYEGETVVAIKGGTEMRTCLWIPVEDFDDAEREALTASVMDESVPGVTTLVHKRRHKVHDMPGMFSRLGVSDADVRDVTKFIDCRKHVRPISLTRLLWDKKDNKRR